MALEDERNPPVAPVRVLVSYSHDSDAHRAAVLELAQQLRADGVDCQLDRFVSGSPPEGWQLWMERQVAAAAHVIVVCSETYLRRYAGRERTGHGRGVTWESILARVDLYEHAPHNTKYVPVLFDGAAPDHIPTPLREHTHYRLPAGYLDLLRYLTQQPAVIPHPVGPVRPLPPIDDGRPALTRSSPTSAAAAALDSAPAWAVESGADRYGRWAAFEAGGQRQRMRWIPPGTFQMGSPVGERGRSGDEGPLHAVTLTQGYWLGETAVTQALWLAVMSANPSKFTGDLVRPVEQVSWDDCQAFLARLDRAVPALAARLPTEAEWERACRGGTTGATWVGELSGEERAAELDPIAWYGGNAGGTTHRVGVLQPNPFGLYDMLGNVWTWCYDAPRLYDLPPCADPVGDQGPYRARRGGAWLSSARRVRAADRSACERGHRYDCLGFRLAGGEAAIPRARP